MSIRVRHNNTVICDIRKAQWAVFGYINQHGQTSRTKPKFSVNGYPSDPNEKAFNSVMTLKEMADKLRIADVWLPRIKIQFAANHSLVYVGKKAVSLNKAWNEHIFNKNKRDWKK
jgi:hypothetical protein